MLNVFYIFSRCSIIVIITLIACESAMYSAFVVDKYILDCNLDAHSIGQFLYLMIYPVREYTEARSSDSFVDHPTANPRQRIIRVLYHFLDTLLVHFLFYPSGT